jgi:outer membrane protein assembly factor BamB
MRRRTYLGLAALATVGSVAGCFGGPQSSDDPGAETDSPPGTATDDGSDEDAPGADSSGSSGPTSGSDGDGWPTFGVDAANTGVHQSGTGPSSASIEWRAIGDAPTVLCSPTVADGTVYTGSAADSVHAFDADTGAARWTADTTSSVPVAPAVREGTVYTADADGMVYALSTDGAERWTSDTGHNLHSRAVGLLDDTLVVGTAGTMPAVVSGDTDASRASKVLGLDVETGDPRWSVDAPDWFTGPAIGGGRVFVGNETGEVFAIEPTDGDVLWSVEPGQAADGDAGSIVAPPTYRDGRVFVGVHGLGQLVVLDAATGKEQWRVDLKAPNVKSSPAVTADRIYIGATGTESTDYDAPGEETPTPTPTPSSTADGGPVEMPTFRTSGSVFAIRREGDGFDWRFETDHDFRSSPAVVGDRVYIGGGDGCYGLSRADGTKQWRIGFGNFVYSSPAVANGRLYIGSADGYLYCIGEN